jgi:hypothetical protein
LDQEKPYPTPGTTFVDVRSDPLASVSIVIQIVTQRAIHDLGKAAETGEVTAHDLPVFQP